jgi:enoyl-CoA hydratase/carnithine racemase
MLDNPPLNLMGPEFVLQIREVVTALENDDRVKVVVFESAVDGVFLSHSDFLANFDSWLPRTPPATAPPRSPDARRIGVSRRGSTRNRQSMAQLPHRRTVPA